MNKIIWIVVGIVIGAAAFYIYEENKPTEMERTVNQAERDVDSSLDKAGREVQKAADQLGDFIDDTADKIDRGMNKELN